MMTDATQPTVTTDTSMRTAPSTSAGGDGFSATLLVKDDTVFFSGIFSLTDLTCTEGPVCAALDHLLRKARHLHTKGPATCKLEIRLGVGRELSLPVSIELERCPGEDGKAARKNLLRRAKKSFSDF